METTTTKATAMTAVRELCVRPRRGADTASAAGSRSFQGWTLSVAGTGTDRRDLLVDVRTAGVDATAPISGVGYPHLEAPPV